jgi:hypothetical protein
MRQQHATSNPTPESTALLPTDRIEPKHREGKAVGRVPTAPATAVAAPTAEALAGLYGPATPPAVPPGSDARPVLNLPIAGVSAQTQRALAPLVARRSDHAPRSSVTRGLSGTPTPNANTRMNDFPVDPLSLDPGAARALGVPSSAGVAGPIGSVRLAADREPGAATTLQPSVLLVGGRRGDRFELGAGTVLAGNGLQDQMPAYHVSGRYSHQFPSASLAFSGQGNSSPDGRLGHASFAVNYSHQIGKDSLRLGGGCSVVPAESVSSDLSLGYKRGFVDFYVQGSHTETRLSPDSNAVNAGIRFPF